MQFYLRIEGVNLDSFVWDTQDLQTVRGGSLLLLKAVAQLTNLLAPTVLEPISTGASSGIFQFEATDEKAAEQLRQKAEQALVSDPQLRYATFVVDVRAASDSFVTDRESLLAKNRWRQMQQPTVAIPSWNKQHGWQVCQVDHLRPARPQADSLQNRRMSLSVKTRFEHGRDQKQNFYWQQTGEVIHEEFSHDLGELASDPTRGNLHNKMAVIYLDGNRFGQLQNDHCTRAETQQQFDSMIRSYRRDALKALLGHMQEHPRAWKSEAGRFRLETLVWGGDEILGVVPAWQAWQTLTLFFQHAKDWTFADQPLTHAGGLVFCRHNAPIHRITQLAHDLAEIAKATDRTTNSLAYTVLESFDHIGRDVEQYLEERYGDASRAVLAAEGMAELAANLTRLKQTEEFPRRKLHQIVHQLSDQPQHAEHIANEVIKGLSKPVQDTLASVRAYVGQEGWGWSHIADLWDYIGQEE